MADEQKPDGAAGEQKLDPEYYKAEAKKAFEARDEYKKKLRELETSGRVITPEQAEKYRQMEEQAAKAEEERAKKAGEWDQLRKQLTDTHQKEIQARDEKLTKAEQALRETLVGLSFAGASEFFGPQGKTILPPKVAESYFGRYVEVQEIEGRRVVVVKGLDGNPILDSKTGHPAPFAAAMGALIDAMPDKDAIVRGSGKAGSGSSGGSVSYGTTNLDDLTKRVQRGDKDAIAEMRERQRSAGGMVMGEAFQKKSA